MKLHHRKNYTFYKSAARRQKKKTRRTADDLTRLFETAALKNEVALRLYKRMTTWKITAVSGRYRRVYFYFLQPA